MGWLITVAVFVVIGIMSWALCASSGMIDDMLEELNKQKSGS